MNHLTQLVQGEPALDSELEAIRLAQLVVAAVAVDIAHAPLPLFPPDSALRAAANRLALYQVHLEHNPPL